MPMVNPKNLLGGAAAADLGLNAGLGVDQTSLMDEEERKKKLLQQQRERMGQNGSSVFGAASMSLFTDAGM